MTDKKETLFDKLYAACEETLTKAKKSPYRKTLKKKFEQASIDCDIKMTEVDEAYEEQLMEFINTPKGFDVNTLLEAQSDMDSAIKTKQVLRDTYKRIFSEELRED